MRYLLTAILVGILTTSTMAMADPCDTDHTCYLLGSMDALGAHTVHLAYDSEGREIESGLEVTCDGNNEVFITSYKYFQRNVLTMCDEVKTLDYPCKKGETDYSDWCGSEAQIKQYKELK